MNFSRKRMGLIQIITWDSFNSLIINMLIS